MCIVHPAATVATSPSPRCAAGALAPDQRQALAVGALTGSEPIARLAQGHQVSRKFVYQQLHIARQGLDQAFAPSAPDDGVLFYLPVTKAWLRQLVLALVLICHSPYRAVVELFRDLLDCRIALGTVHNIVRSAVEPARAISGRFDLAGVRNGALDEIFQAQKPVLV